MENFFDIATPDELVDFLGEDDPELPASLRGYAFERKSAQENQDYNFGLLASLYFARGDKRRADKCLATIKDEQYRLDASISIYELQA